MSGVDLPNTDNHRHCEHCEVGAHCTDLIISVGTLTLTVTDTLNSLNTVLLSVSVTLISVPSATLTLILISIQKNLLI